MKTNPKFEALLTEAHSAAAAAQADAILAHVEYGRKSDRSCIENGNARYQYPQASRGYDADAGDRLRDRRVDYRGLRPQADAGPKTRAR